MKNDQSLKFRILYNLLIEKKNNNMTLRLKEIMIATDWKESTFNTYYSKKLKGKFLIKKNDVYLIQKIDEYDEESFLRLMSQNQNKSEKPFKKELKCEVEQFLNKAIDSAYLAVDIYNRPQTKFRTDGYIVMMIIAWTSLFHSVFEELGIDYFYKETDGSYKTIDGDKKTWELLECLKNTTKIDDAVKENLKFMIGLRNKIEHRFIPELDIQVCGECQAMLLNFEELLTKEYGKISSLAANLAIPLQLINYSDEQRIKAMEKFQSNNFNDVKEYICDFRSALSDEIYNDMRYSFKVFLVPKLKNHKGKDDISMEFLNIKDIEESDYNEMLKTITLIKEKLIEVPISNKDNYRPSQVCQKVSEKINMEFKVHHHVNAWKYFKVRKKGHQAEGCDPKYCHYDFLHEDYSYTEEWIDFLADTFTDIQMYEKIINYREK